MDTVCTLCSYIARKYFEVRKSAVTSEIQKLPIPIFIQNRQIQYKQSKQMQRLFLLTRNGCHKKYFFPVIKDRLFRKHSYFVLSVILSPEFYLLSFNNLFTRSTGNLSSISIISNRFNGNFSSPIRERYSSTALRSIMIFPRPAQWRLLSFFFKPEIQYSSPFSISV